MMRGFSVDILVWRSRPEGRHLEEQFKEVELINFLTLGQVFWAVAKSSREIVVMTELSWLSMSLGRASAMMLSSPST